MVKILFVVVVVRYCTCGSCFVFPFSDECVLRCYLVVLCFSMRSTLSCFRPTGIASRWSQPLALLPPRPPNSLECELYFARIYQLQANNFARSAVFGLSATRQQQLTHTSPTMIDLANVAIVGADSFCKRGTKSYCIEPYEIHHNSKNPFLLLILCCFFLVLVKNVKFTRQI